MMTDPSKEPNAGAPAETSIAPWISEAIEKRHICTLRNGQHVLLEYNHETVFPVRVCDLVGNTVAVVNGNGILNPFMGKGDCDVVGVHNVELNIGVDHPANDERLKNREGKLKWDLLPWEPLEECVRVMQSAITVNGYAPHSWKEVPNGELEYKRACGRHLAAIMCGKDTDAKSGLPHLAHLVCSALIALWHRNNKVTESK